jgi:hypothetical protein
MNQFLDSKGSALVVGGEYVLVTYGENGITPAPAEEWIRATWNGQSLLDKGGCTWTEWLAPKGKNSSDVVPA